MSLAVYLSVWCLVIQNSRLIYILFPSAEESTVRSLPDSSGETQSRLYHRERVVAVIVQSDTDKLVRKKEKSKHKPYFYVAVVYRP